MTALERYVRLEAIGLLRETPDAPPREVVVSLGRHHPAPEDLDERPLGHWALAGVVRLGADGRRTVYSMTADGAETLTIRDRDMVEAIAALSRPRPRAAAAPPPRRRLPLLPLVAARRRRRARRRRPAAHPRPRPRASCRRRAPPSSATGC